MSQFKTTCRTCKVSKPIEEFYPRRKGKGATRADCKNCYNTTLRSKYAANPKQTLDRTKRYKLNLKLQFIAAYGGKCTCCGEHRPDFLTIEHKNNDGKAHRVALIGRNDGGTTKILIAARNAGYPDIYTVLCFNCNIARSLFGKCPHETEGAK